MSQIVGRNPNLCTLHAGITDFILPEDSFELGEGLILKKTYAHIMSPQLMAFAKPEPGKHHPAPWKSISGGASFDIETQLIVPKEFSRENWFDRLNTIWLLITLLRLKSRANIAVPVVADVPFEEVVKEEKEKAFWPIEHRKSFIPLLDQSESPNLDDLKWLKSYWLTAGNLANENEDFYSAIAAADSARSLGNAGLAMVMLWGALERIFCNHKQELSLRLSIFLSAYLEPRGKMRLATFKEIKKLYTERSKAAHGHSASELKSFQRTYELLRKALLKIIEENAVPTPSRLEELALSE